VSLNFNYQAILKDFRVSNGVTGCNWAPGTNQPAQGGQSQSQPQPQPVQPAPGGGSSVTPGSPSPPALPQPQTQPPAPTEGSPPGEDAGPPSDLVLKPPYYTFFIDSM